MLLAVAQSRSLHVHPKAKEMQNNLTGKRFRPDEGEAESSEKQESEKEPCRLLIIGIIKFTTLNRHGGSLKGVWEPDSWV